MVGIMDDTPGSRRRDHEGQGRWVMQNVSETVKGSEILNDVTEAPTIRLDRSAERVSRRRGSTVSRSKRPVATDALTEMGKLDVSVSHADIAITMSPTMPGQSPLYAALRALATSDVMSLCTPARGL